MPDHMPDRLVSMYEEPNSMAEMLSSLSGIPATWPCSMLGDRNSIHGVPGSILAEQVSMLTG